ncbi:hypothetical protein NQ314_020755 [Rhamnusium bicolor]|uniref:Disease resistance R13L4/SHOC-2-like LRR domain-containing protein n=1 Tax=Rhamnusium bicolor TaxID=1586634 RepID=A0AAV8WK89_9CUCU|nr:hypothetical protein NQ314_020755 [Rhamnusium bicolor]
MGWLTCCQCKTREEKITELDFSRCGISEVPNDVYANSPTLEVLHLEGNKLKDLSPQLFQCIDLRYLNVSDNEIRTMPPLISKLTNLQVLIFSKNVLDGVHPNLDKLSKLTMLDLSMNDLGKVPDAIMSLINLQQLCLNDTGIDFVPANIGRLSNLRVLELRDNNLCELPKSIRRLTNLQRLDVSDNNLSNLTEGNLRNLQVLKLESNYLEDLPSTICKLINLEELNLQNNSLNKVPSGIGHLRKLATLILSDNKLKQLPAEIGSCCELSILNVHNNQLEKLPDEVGHLQNLTTLGLIGNKLSYLPITISKLRNLKALWLTPNQTQPLIHLQNEHLPDGQIVLTSIVFPQAPLRDPPPNLQLPLGNQTCHITFNTERTEPDITDANLSLSRTPTPHHKELKRLREILRNTHIPGSQVLNVSEIKEAKVTHISGDNNVSQASLNGHEETLEVLESLSDITRETNKTPPKQPPPYHIAAAYSKNAHLFMHNLNPPSPHDQPKQFSQQQPTNIHMPTPKMPNHRHQLIPVDRHVPALQIVDDKIMRTTSTSTEEDFNQTKQVKWPFGKHKVCQVLEVELPESFTPDDFRIAAQSDGIFIDEINSQSPVFERLFVGDKILAFDDIDYSVVDPMEAYRDACQRIGNIKTITVSRRQTM